MVDWRLLYLSLWGPKIEAKQLVKCAMQLLREKSKINCLATKDGGQIQSVREQCKINEGYY